MGLYRDETGQVFSMDDAFANARGYSPVDPTEEQQIYAEDALDDEADGGALGTLHAGATGFASGMTLGLSDVLLGQGLPDDEREALVRELEAHPIAHTGGEVAGTIVASMRGMPKTPTGYLSQLAGREVEHGLAQGGVKGTARALNAMGVEGSIQSAGQYIGHSALEDKEVTAEGVAGALGTGYAFGAAGGGAVLGVSRGTMAARRLFSRVMDGEQAAKDAASSWSLVREEALQADHATSQTLQTRLDEIQNAKREAMKYRNETKAMTEEERIRAAAAGPTRKAEMSPEEALMAPAKGGSQTGVFKRPAVDEPFVGPEALDAGIAPAGSGAQTSVKRVDYTPEGTKVIPRERVAEAPAGEKTALEEQLAGTKAKIDEGKSLKEIKASKGNDSNEIEKMLAEKRAFDAGERTGVRNMGPQLPEKYGPRPDARRFMNLRAQIGKKLLPQDLAQIRREATSELLSPAIAEEEARLVEAIDEIKAAREAMDRVHAKIAGDGITDEQLAALRQDNPTFAGKPADARKRVMEALDSAHEDALMNANTTGDGSWLERADQVEKMMFDLPDEKDIYWNLADDIKVVERYERAIAKAADVAGDGAHPSAQGLSKGISQAERDAESRMFDRTTRAIDDASDYGPIAKTPKERVQYARERQLDAQRSVDSLSGQEADVGADLKKAKERVRTGERDKKSLLREEAKATKGSGISEKLGIWEILDLPGMPKISDLPVVGPILGAWLKFRTIKAALGRKMGTVTASGDARAAALASRTRDRIARAVDRSLGLAEKGSRVAAKNTPRVAAVLANRIYDDGQPDAPKGAPIGVQAATRIRELAAYVNTPNAIERDVRLALRGVSDPDLIAAAEKHRRAMMEYLLANAPKAPEQGMMQTIKWQPSPAESMSFARRWEAVHDPAGAWERFEQAHAALSLETADALRNVYPQLFTQAQQRVMQQIAATNAATKSVPYRTRIQMSLFYQLPLDAALEPANLKITQSVYERKVAIPPPGAPQPPMPSVAGDTNLTALFQTAADSRAMR
jgi:hypothetical protein